MGKFERWRDEFEREVNESTRHRPDQVVLHLRDIGGGELGSLFAVRQKKADTDNRWEERTDLAVSMMRQRGYRLVSSEKDKPFARRLEFTRERL